MQRGSAEVQEVDGNYHFWVTDIFEHPGYPRLHFIERRYAGDPTNWWIPNRACTEAMLRSSGFDIFARPEEEVFICRRREIEDVTPRAVYPAPAPHGGRP